MYRIVYADTTNIELIIQVAEKTWTKTYAPILSSEQVLFMYEKLFTPSAIALQMDEGYIFAIVVEDEKAMGFISYKINTNEIYVSKLYVCPEFHGIGIGKLLLLHVEKQGISLGKTFICLNVNKHNPAIKFYNHNGYKIIRSEDIPYYQFTLNDYILQKEVRPIPPQSEGVRHS